MLNCWTWLALLNTDWQGGDGKIYFKVSATVGKGQRGHGVNLSIQNPILVPISCSLGYLTFYSVWLKPGQRWLPWWLFQLLLVLRSICFSRFTSYPPSTLAKAISLQGRVQSKIKQWWLKPIPWWSGVKDLSYNPVVSFAPLASPRATVFCKEALEQGNKNI
jgi:hypothetical protein